MDNKKFGNIFKGDKVIWMVFFFLCLISIVEVFSASSELTYKGGSYAAPIIKHIGLLGVGVFLAIVTLNIKCKYFKFFTPFVLIIAVSTLFWVDFAGHSTNDAQRWLSIFGIQFQPSEIGKGALVLATAQVLSAMQTERGADRHAMPYILVVCAFIIPFIMVENLSTAALLCSVIFFMMIIGRVPVQQLGKLVGSVALVIVLVVATVMIFGHDNEEASPEGQLTEQVDGKQPEKAKSGGMLHRLDTWKSRIDKFSNHEEIPPEKVDLDKDAQTAHANIAIASSNIIGKGPGNSVERDFLSQAFSDFIYAIIIEELGIEGAAFVFLAMGLALLLVTQALFNMCVAVGLVPVTGQPLPLISKGGTSTIINCIYVGAILSVSRTAKKIQEPQPMKVAVDNTASDDKETNV